MFYSWFYNEKTNAIVLKFSFFLSYVLMCLGFFFLTLGLFLTSRTSLNFAFLCFSFALFVFGLFGVTVNYFTVLALWRVIENNKNEIKEDLRGLIQTTKHKETKELLYKRCLSFLDNV